MGRSRLLRPSYRSCTAASVGRDRNGAVVTPPSYTTDCGGHLLGAVLKCADERNLSEEIEQLLDEIDISTRRRESIDAPSTVDSELAGAATELRNFIGASGEALAVGYVDSVIESARQRHASGRGDPPVAGGTAGTLTAPRRRPPVPLLFRPGCPSHVAAASPSPALGSLSNVDSDDFALGPIGSSLLPSSTRRQLQSSARVGQLGSLGFRRIEGTPPPLQNNAAAPLAGCGAGRCAVHSAGEPGASAGRLVPRGFAGQVVPTSGPTSGPAAEASNNPAILSQAGVPGPSTRECGSASELEGEVPSSPHSSKHRNQALPRRRIGNDPLSSLVRLAKTAGPAPQEHPGKESDLNTRAETAPQSQVGSPRQPIASRINGLDPSLLKLQRNPSGGEVPRAVSSSQGLAIAATPSNVASKLRALSKQYQFKELQLRVLQKELLRIERAIASLDSSKATGERGVPVDTTQSQHCLPNETTAAAALSSDGPSSVPIGSLPLGSSPLCQYGGVGAPPGRPTVFSNQEMILSRKKKIHAETQCPTDPTTTDYVVEAARARRFQTEGGVEQSIAYYSDVVTADCNDEAARSSMCPNSYDCGLQLRRVAAPVAAPVAAVNEAKHLSFVHEKLREVRKQVMQLQQHLLAVSHCDSRIPKQHELQPSNAMPCAVAMNAQRVNQLPGCGPPRDAGFTETAGAWEPPNAQHAILVGKHTDACAADTSGSEPYSAPATQQRNDLSFAMAQTAAPIRMSSMPVPVATPPSSNPATLPQSSWCGGQQQHPLYLPPSKQRFDVRVPVDRQCFSSANGVGSCKQVGTDKCPYDDRCLLLPATDPPETAAPIFESLDINLARSGGNRLDPWRHHANQLKQQDQDHHCLSNNTQSGRQSGRQSNIVTGIRSESGETDEGIPSTVLPAMSGSPKLSSSTPRLSLALRSPDSTASGSAPLSTSLTAAPTLRLRVATAGAPQGCCCCCTWKPTVASLIPAWTTAGRSRDFADATDNGATADSSSVVMPVAQREPTYYYYLQSPPSLSTWRSCARIPSEPGSAAATLRPASDCETLKTTPEGDRRGYHLITTRITPPLRLQPEPPTTLRLRRSVKRLAYCYRPRRRYLRRGQRLERADKVNLAGPVLAQHRRSRCATAGLIRIRLVAARTAVAATPSLRSSFRRSLWGRRALARRPLLPAHRSLLRLGAIPSQIRHTHSQRRMIRSHRTVNVTSLERSTRPTMGSAGVTSKGDVEGELDTEVLRP